MSLNVSDHGAGRIGPQEGPVGPQPQRAVSPALKPLANGVEGTGRAARKPPVSLSEIPMGAAKAKIAAINAGKEVGQVAKIAINSKQTQVLPRTKAAPTSQPATSTAVDRLRAAAANLTREQVAAKLKREEADTSPVDRLRAAAAGLTREQVAAKMKGQETDTSTVDRLRAAAAGLTREQVAAKLKGEEAKPAELPPPPKATEQKGEHAIPDDLPPPPSATTDAKGKEEIDFVPDEDIVIHDEALGPQPEVAKEAPKPNPIKAALHMQLSETKDGITNLKPEAERKEMASSLALGYKLTKMTTEQLMTQLTGILTDPSSSPADKEFAVDTLKSWVDQRAHQKDLANKETMTAFKELVKVVPADRQAELFAGQASPLAAATKPSALTSMREAQDPAALMKRVKSGKAEAGDVLAAATAIREKNCNRLATFSPSNVAQGKVIVAKKHWNTVDPSVKQSVKTMDAFTLQFKSVIDNAKNAKEAGNVLRFYYDTAAKLAELGDFDSAFNIQTSITNINIYEHFRDRFGAEKGGWNGFLEKTFGDPKAEGSTRQQLEDLVKHEKNYKVIRDRTAEAGPDKGILPMALICKGIEFSLNIVTFTNDEGLPDIAQLQMTKKAVLDPLLNLRALGQVNRTTSHPLQELLLPQAIIDKSIVEPND